jgi:hypothetical protein
MPDGQTDFIIQQTSCEANIRSASQEIRALWNPNVHYHVQESTSGPYPELDECSPHSPTLFPRSILNVSFHLRQCRPSVHFTSFFSDKRCTHY